MRKGGISRTEALSMVQPSILRRVYEIRTGGERSGGLSFDRFFGSRASGDWGGDSWTIATSGFLRPRTSIRHSRSEAEIAACQHSIWSRTGTLTFPDGRQFACTSGAREDDFQITTAEGETVIRFTVRGNLALSVDIVVAKRSPEIPVLLMLGCYLVAVAQEEKAGAAAATVAAMG